MSKLTLRPYQQDAVNNTISHFKKSNNSAVIVLPTGSGKSLVIAELAAIAKHRVLVITHVKELVEQNYQKFQQYGLEASIFSAGLKQKNQSAKVVFASIQSVVRNLTSFNAHFSLIIIDECHRMTIDEDSQYQKTINSLKENNQHLKVLGLTATPYRLGLGWIYQYHYHGYARSNTDTPFKQCIYELPLGFMIKNKYLTPPKLYDATIAEYDFSKIKGYEEGRCSTTELNRLLTKKQRVTKSIIDQVIALSQKRTGIMIFAATVKHAQEILNYLPPAQSALITGETHNTDRDRLISLFKEKEIKYLVNVSVLTTGFDAPHVDVIAILRPTQSISLFQQIVGRGLRLAKDKKDCLILDYTGSQFNIFHPEVGEKKPSSDSEPVQVFCPLCDFANTFWGKCDENGNILEHFGRRCKGLIASPDSLSDQVHTDDNPLINQKDPRCQFRFRFKNCPQCDHENDIAARECLHCHALLVDPDDTLKKALLLKDAKVIRCAGLTFDKHNEKLRITYHDEEGETLCEYLDLSKPGQLNRFHRNYSKRLQSKLYHNPPSTIDQIISLAQQYTAPDFVIARKNGHFWNIVDKIFDYQGKYRKANAL